MGLCYVDAFTVAELVEKRKQRGSEKRSNNGVERKRREKTLLDGSPIEASLRGIVKARSASSVRRVSLEKAAEKGGPWPFIV